MKAVGHVFLYVGTWTDFPIGSGDFGVEQKQRVASLKPKVDGDKILHKDRWDRRMMIATCIA